MPELSIIIATRDRVESLRETLRLLELQDASAARFEVFVVDNGSRDGTPELVRSFESRYRLHYLFEPCRDGYGKAHALNRALESRPEGALIAILDDDMSPEAGWVAGVLRAAERNPGCDLFSGRSFIVWPEGPVPGWARSPRLHSWAFSVQGCGPQDAPLSSGQWFSGNHFWFCSRVLADGRRFAATWLTEPRFILDLVEDGHRGLHVPDAVVGHRIQPHLLDQDVIRHRARLVGQAFARERLQPFRNSVRKAVLCRAHPLAARAYCLSSLAKWQLLRLARVALVSPDRRFETEVASLERIAHSIEVLKILHSDKAYRLFRKSSEIG